MNKNIFQPWITNELKQSMCERDIIKSKAIHSKDPKDWFAFKKARNFVNSEIKHAKEIHYKYIHTYIFRVRSTLH